MNVYMSFKVTEIVKIFVTHITRKRTLSTMSPFMQPQGILMLERLFTDVT